VLALAGWKVVFLGAHTPLASVLGAVRRGARALCVSVSEAADPATTTRALDEVVRGLEPGVALSVGGDGAPDGAWLRFTDLRALASWAEATR
jgi:hypothetical protein